MWGAAFVACGRTLWRFGGAKPKCVTRFPSIVLDSAAATIFANLCALVFTFGFVAQVPDRHVSVQRSLLSAPRLERVRRPVAENRLRSGSRCTGFVLNLLIVFLSGSVVSTRCSWFCTGCSFATLLLPWRRSRQLAVRIWRHPRQVITLSLHFSFETARIVAVRTSSDQSWCFAGMLRKARRERTLALLAELWQARPLLRPSPHNKWPPPSSGCSTCSLQLGRCWYDELQAFRRFD